MMRSFRRRRSLRATSGSATGSSDPRAAGGPPVRAGRRARPGAEALDPRLLLAAPDPGISDRVAQALQPYFAQGQFPGISVAIVTDGQVALAEGYGVAEVSSGSPARADTRFDIGSVTKTFTAMGVLMLYHGSQGTPHPLDLDERIGKYLNNNRSFKLPVKWAKITVRELLDMTSGLRDVGDARPWQAQLRSIANRSLLFAPGTHTSYSSANYNLLGELIEQWTGESYSTFIQQQILGPLGMSQSQVLGRSATVPNQAVGYGAPHHGRWPKAALQNGPAMYASAGMVSTAQDMATYMMALLNDRILDPATSRLMWTAVPTPQYGSRPATTGVPGLGWDQAIDASAGPVEVFKSGSVPGFTSELILYPSADSGVFVSFNSNRHGSASSNGATALQVANAVYAAAQSGS